MTSLLVVDIGTSGVRSSIVADDGSVGFVHHEAVLPSTPAPGLVEVDAERIAQVVLATATAALADGGPVAGVGIANQRASTLVWDRKTGTPVGPALGWQDLRTVGTCLALRGEGWRFPPNASATKLAAILDQVDPDRSRAADELCFGTFDSWCAWVLSGGRLHVTDPTNAAVTALTDPSGARWNDRALEVLGIPASMLPQIVDSSGAIGEAAELAGAPTICGLAGDQQAALVGQGCTRPGLAKATFGTGGMLDQCTGATVPGALDRSDGGTFPIVTWRRGGRTAFGVEAMMLSAGSCIEWLRDDLGILPDAASSADVAGQCEDTGDVWFVPALLGMATPVWDFGARGALLGITRGTGRPEIVRAVLDGVAHRGADLLEAAESDSGLGVSSLRVDGGMSANPVFVQALADAIGRPVELSATLEATTLGAGYLAGMATGAWQDEDDVADSYRPARTIEPTLGDDARASRRARWLEARSRALETIPELSTIEF
ncbi:MAG: FGGY family carbohydrate kinase [Acidimicrobiales bacterium]